MFLKQLMLAVTVAVAACSAHAADEIRFVKATNIVTSRMGMSQEFLRFEASVANLAYDKQVYARVNIPGTGWVDVPLSYNRSVNGNREIWVGTWGGAVGNVFDARFALKYVVNGQTYWDNNAGNDYTVARDAGNLLPNGVNVYQHEWKASAALGAGGFVLSGRASVRNLDVNKVVRVHYTTDGWATKKIALAQYNSTPWASWYSSNYGPNVHGVEEWDFNLDVGTSSTQVEYAIEYTVAGRTYWDNNFGANYRTTFVR